MGQYTVEPLSHEILSELRTHRRRWAHPEIYEKLLAGEGVAVRFDAAQLGETPEEQRHQFTLIRSTVNRWAKKRGIVCEHRFDTEKFLAIWHPKADGSKPLEALYPKDVVPKPPKTSGPKPGKSAFEKKMRPPDPPDLMSLFKIS